MQGDEQEPLRAAVKLRQRGQSAWKLAQQMGIPHRVLLAFLMGQPLPDAYAQAVRKWIGV